jgi:hypothetical protein
VIVTRNDSLSTCGKMLPVSSPPRAAVTSWQEAEYNAAAWMRHWGFRDATADPGGADGGIDIRSSRAFAQVKYQAAHVGRPDLQRLVGARGRALDRQLLMFSGAGFTADAGAYADEMEIALFVYALDGAMTPVNPAAARIASQTPGRQLGATTQAPRRTWPRMLMYLFSLLLFIMPFRTFDDPNLYVGPFALDVIKFLGILIFCWVFSLVLLAAARAHRRRQLSRPDVGD